METVARWNPLQGASAYRCFSQDCGKILWFSIAAIERIPMENDGYRCFSTFIHNLSKSSLSYMDDHS